MAWHGPAGGNQTALSGSAPRLLVHAAQHAIVEVIEEFVGADSSNGHYFNNSVAEVFVEEEAQVKHGYVQVRRTPRTGACAAGTLLLGVYRYTVVGTLLAMVHDAAGRSRRSLSHSIMLSCTCMPALPPDIFWLCVYCIACGGAA